MFIGELPSKCECTASMADTRWSSRRRTVEVTLIKQGAGDTEDRTLGVVLTRCKQLAFSRFTKPSSDVHREENVNFNIF